MAFRRIKKADRVGSVSVSGDRVRLSQALESALIRRGQIEPRKRTYAVSIKKNEINGLTKLKYLESEREKQSCEINPEDQQLALPLDAPIVDLLSVAEAKRRAAGIPQRRLAEMLGIQGNR